MIDIDQAKAHPEEHFSNPQAVFDHPELDSEHKIEILESWRHELQQLIVAEEENMTADEQLYKEEENLLNQIHELLVALKHPEE